MIKGYSFIYENNRLKAHIIKVEIKKELESITLKQFNKFHYRHQFRLFRMYRYLKGGGIDDENSL